MKKTALHSFLATIAIAGGLAGSGLAATSGQALAAEQLSVQYDLYTRGMRAFALNYDARIEPTAYSASAKLRPKGLASLIVDPASVGPSRARVRRSRFARRSS